MIEIMMMALLGFVLAVDNRYENQVPTELVNDKANKESIFQKAADVTKAKPFLGPGDALFSADERDRMIRLRRAKESSFLKIPTGFRKHSSAQALYNAIYAYYKEPPFWNSSNFIEEIVRSLYIHKSTLEAVTRQVWETLKPELRAQYSPITNVKYPSSSKPRPCPKCKVYRAKDSSSAITTEDYNKLPRADKKLYEDQTAHSRNSNMSTTLECRDCGEIVGCFGKFENPVRWRDIGPQFSEKFHVNTAVGILLSDNSDREWELTFIRKIPNGEETMTTARRIVTGILKSIGENDAPNYAPGGDGSANVAAFEVEGE